MLFFASFVFFIEPPSPVEPTPTLAVETVETVETERPYDYNPVGKRDPFRSISTTTTCYLGWDGTPPAENYRLVGVIVGTYSSIYVASPVLLYLMNRAEGGQKAPEAA